MSAYFIFDMPGNALLFNQPVTLRRCRIKKGWHEEGKEGFFYGIVHTNRNWAIVVWDGDDDPDLFRAEGIETQTTNWIGLQETPANRKEK